MCQGPRRIRRCSIASSRPPTRADADGGDLVIEAVFEDPRDQGTRCSPRSRRTWPRTGASLLQHLDAADQRARRRRTHAARRVHRPALLQPGGPDAAGRDHPGRATGSEETRRTRARRRASRCARRRSSSTTARGFFTSRVIGTFTDEGVAMLGEGIAGRVDRAGRALARLPGAGASALGRAEPPAPAPQDSARSTRRGRHRPKTAKWRPHPGRTR